MEPKDDPGWDSYAKTVLIARVAAPFSIDVGHPVTGEARGRLAECGLVGAFGVVTPCNPRGQRLPSEENDARLAHFLAELDAAGKRYLRLDGISPDGLHVEPGVALAWPRADVLALARRWEQSAIYWWDTTDFWVVGALTQAPPWRLGGAP